MRFRKTYKNILEILKQHDIEQYILKEYKKNDHSKVIELEVGIQDKKDFYAPFMTPNQKSLNSDILTFIEEKAFHIPFRYPIDKIVFYVPMELIKEEENSIKELFFRHYWIILNDKKWNLKINLFKSIGIFAFGTIMFLLYFILRTTSGAFASEVLSIIATFSIWEFADFFLLERSKIRFEILNYFHIFSAKIEFKMTQSK